MTCSKLVLSEKNRVLNPYLESNLELFGRLDKELQAVLHHAGSCRVREMPCGTIIKSFSALALTLSRAGAKV